MTDKFPMIQMKGQKVVIIKDGYLLYALNENYCEGTNQIHGELLRKYYIERLQKMGQQQAQIYEQIPDVQSLIGYFQLQKQEEMNKKQEQKAIDNFAKKGNTKYWQEYVKDDIKEFVG